MKQYCRYCCYLVTGNEIYCEKREHTMSKAAAKATEPQKTEGEVMEDDNLPDFIK